MNDLAMALDRHSGKCWECWEGDGCDLRKALEDLAEAVLDEKWLEARQIAEAITGVTSLGAVLALHGPVTP